MIRGTTSNISTTAFNLDMCAHCMDELAVQMDESAIILQTSAMSTVIGNTIESTAASLVERAKQIRGITADFRASGDMANFEQACQLAGWQPDRGAIAKLQTSH